MLKIINPLSKNGMYYSIKAKKFFCKLPEILHYFTSGPDRNSYKGLIHSNCEDEGYGGCAIFRTADDKEIHSPIYTCEKGYIYSEWPTIIFHNMPTAMWVPRKSLPTVMNRILILAITSTQVLVPEKLPRRVLDTVTGEPISWEALWETSSGRKMAIWHDDGKARSCSISNTEKLQASSPSDNFPIETLEYQYTSV